MPRTYKSKNKYRKYDPEVLLAAIEDLSKSNSTLSKVASKYKITKSVLHRHSKKTMKTLGGQTGLTQEKEEYILQILNAASDWCYSLDTVEFRYIVKMYLDEIGIQHKIFKNNFPGVDFARNFLKRHKNKISPSIIANKTKAEKCSPDAIKKYFEHLEKALEDVPCSNIINYNEFKLSDNPEYEEVLIRRKCKYPKKVTDHSETGMSIMLAGTADGIMLPSYIVYKASDLCDTWVQGGPEGTWYNRSQSGWFDGPMFEDWFKQIIMPYIENKPGKKCLIGDKVSTHLSISLIKLCKDTGIDFVFIPTHSTCFTQPMDVAFFPSLYSAWKELLLEWRSTNAEYSGNVPKECLPRLLRALFDLLADYSSNNIIVGFKATGISPLNENVILNILPQELDSIQKKTANSSVLQPLQIDANTETSGEMDYGYNINMNRMEPKNLLKIFEGQILKNDVLGSTVLQSLQIDGNTEISEETDCGYHINMNRTDPAGLVKIIQKEILKNEADAKKTLSIDLYIKKSEQYEDVQINLKYID